VPWNLVTNILGPPGERGSPGWSETVQQFTIPQPGLTVSVELEDADWCIPGQMVWVENSGTAGSAGALQITAKNGNIITLLNPVVPAPPAPVVPPRADSTFDGLMQRVSGNIGDYISGENMSRPLPNIISTMTTGSGLSAMVAALTTGASLDALIAALAELLVPTGVVLDFAGNIAPVGFAMCDGSFHSTTGPLAKLFSVIGYTHGGFGGTFQLPDPRGRTGVGAGQGTGLTNRTIGDIGGTETHVLTVAQLASHTHQYLAANAAGGGATFVAGANFNWGSTQATGNDEAHPNMQPFIVWNKIIKT